MKGAVLKLVGNLGGLDILKTWRQFKTIYQ